MPTPEGHDACLGAIPGAAAACCGHGVQAPYILWDYPYRWRVRTRLADRFGQRCRVLCRGAMNSCVVEFADGFRVVTSRWYVRRMVGDS